MVEVVVLLFGYVLDCFGWFLVVFVGVVGGDCVVYVVDCVYVGGVVDGVVGEFFWVVVVVGFFVVV